MSFVAQHQGAPYAPPSAKPKDPLQPTLHKSSAPPPLSGSTRGAYENAQDKARRKDYAIQFSGLSAYDQHKMFIRDYVKYYGRNKAAEPLPEKSDWDVLMKEFIRNDSTEELRGDWEKRFAKSYYDKLVRNYCIGDFSRYKEKKIGLRWRTEEEVFEGKGQFICGAVGCDSRDGLRSYEVNFAYKERGEKKNALVKIKLCSKDKKKLFYKAAEKQMREIEKEQRREERRDLRRREKKLKRAEEKERRRSKRKKESRRKTDSSSSESSSSRRTSKKRRRGESSTPLDETRYKKRGTLSHSSPARSGISDEERTLKLFNDLFA